MSSSEKISKDYVRVSTVTLSGILPGNPAVIQTEQEQKIKIHRKVKHCGGD